MYHINPETQRPNLCRAKTPEACKYAQKGQVPPHFSTKEEAREHVAEQNAQEYSTVPQVMQRRTSSRFRALPEQERAALLSRINTLPGLQACVAEDCGMTFYHESSTEPPSPGKIRSYEPHSDSSWGLPSKPRGVLWLSPGERDDSGKVITGWRQWCLREDYNPPTNHHTYAAQWEDKAVILDITEAGLPYLDKVFDPEAPQHQGNISMMSNWGHLLTGEESFQAEPFQIRWEKLREAGIDAVRVNGATEQDFFYGYDCDSLIVLDGSAIRGWNAEEAVESDPYDFEFEDTFISPTRDDKP